MSLVRRSVSTYMSTELDAHALPPDQVAGTRYPEQVMHLQGR